MRKSFLFILICVGILTSAVVYSLKYPNKPLPFDTNITFEGYVVAEPDIRTDAVRYTIKTKEHGRVLVKYSLYPRFSYGDVLQVKCRLRKPEPIEDFRYDMYLARFDIFATCSNPKIMYLGSGEGNAIMQSILQLKENVAYRINKLWPEPHASFMAGLLYGYRGGLGSLNELFSRTGVTHIVAISGYNITLIATILMSIYMHLYIPRKKAFWCIVIGIMCFLVFAGLSASVVRAGIMGIIVLVARQCGRPSQIARVLIYTAVIMALHSPYILLWDAGFQLSFISTLGLIYLAPKIEKYFTKIPEVFALRESVVSTCAAIAATLPLILYQFGRLSIVAPIVNVLILWIIPWIMMVGFIAVVMHVVFAPIAHVLAWVSYAGLEYIIVVVKWFAGLEFAAVDFVIPVWGMVGLYVGMVVWLGEGYRTQMTQIKRIYTDNNL